MLLAHILSSIHSVIEATPSTPPSDNSLVYILSLIAGGGLLTAFVSYLRLRKQGTAEKEEIIAKAAEQAVGALQVSMTRLEKDLDKARIEKAEIENQLKTGVARRIDLDLRVSELNARIRSLEESIIGYRSRKTFIKTVADTYESVLLINLKTGIIDYANPATHVMFGYTQGVLDKGITFGELLPIPFRPEFREIQNDLLKDPKITYLNDRVPDIRGLNKAGESISVVIRVTPLDNELAIVMVREVH